MADYHMPTAAIACACVCKVLPWADSVVLCSNVAVSGCPPACAHLGNPDCGLYRSTFDGMRKIARREGVTALWRGTDIAFLMAIPTVSPCLTRTPAYTAAPELRQGCLTQDWQQASRLLLLATEHACADPASA